MAKEIKNSTEADRQLIRKLNGLYVGQLDDDEMESFRRCVKDRVAVNDYGHPGGLFNLAKIRYTG